MNKSRIPVSAPMKRTAKPVLSEQNPPNPALPARGRNLNSDARAPKTGLNRFRSEANVRIINQMLTEEIARLKKQLAGSQEVNIQLSEGSEKLRNEVAELKSQLEKYTTLEFEILDPVSGESLPSFTEEISKQREETKLYTGKLMQEIQDFTQAAAVQSSLTQSLMAKLCAEQQSRYQFKAEQHVLQGEMERCKASLQETHRWLDAP
uniref:Uncharacterized protein n=1 Tax=Leptobrachium leishanense TaxID=445787 RepID=A0A8C5MLC8_9ANUR